MTGLTIRTSAKVNLCLRVLGRRADGYHEIETVLHTVGLWDRLSLSPIPGEPRIALEANTPDVSLDEGNLCWRAADLIARHAKAPDGVAIRLEKSIPVAAGLGGGSSDAAATLVGLARLWELDLAPEEVASLAAQLGADVPFFLRGGCCLARGRGEELDPVPELSAWLVLVVPERRVPTAQAYAALRRGAARGRRKGLTRAAQRVVRALREGDVTALAGSLHNDFEDAGMAAIADAREAKAALVEAGCLGAVLSGSGPSVFGIAPDSQAAGAIAERLRPRWPWVLAVPTVPARDRLTIGPATEA